MTKMLRRQARKEAKKRDERILPELKDFLNKLPLRDRIRAAWLIAWGKF
jgi:hypothetical protein